MTYATALVTGASSGIGYALAKRLAAEGTHVVVSARRARELEGLAGEIRAAGGRARVQPLDVADAEQTVATIRALDQELGGFDLIVANAGIGLTMPANKLNWEAIAAMCRVNFDGALATLTAVLPRMLERRRGHLVGVSSLAALGPLPGSAAYCASKAGLTMFLESLRLDLLGTGVHATAIHPGFVKTPMTARNRFPMPFMLDCDTAVDLIVRQLPKAPATIDFPFPLAAAVRFNRALPRPVRDVAMRRQKFAR
jgi:short-subunit dehydrogenase